MDEIKKLQEREAKAFAGWFERHDAQGLFMIVRGNLDCAAQHIRQLPVCDERTLVFDLLEQLRESIDIMEQKSK
jgi:hypothetical protein